MNCFWDAGTRGNGSGLSFYVRELPGKAGMVCVFYVKRSDLDYCD